MSSRRKEGAEKRKRRRRSSAHESIALCFLFVKESISPRKVFIPRYADNRCDLNDMHILYFHRRSLYS